MDSHRNANSRQRVLRQGPAVLGATLVLAGLFALGRRNFLLFHCLTEAFSIIIAIAVFTIFWNARRFFEYGFFLIVGFGCLAAGAFDVIYVFAYKGMSVFAGADGNLALQAKTVAQWFVSLSCLLSIFFLRRKINQRLALLIYGGISAAALAAIFWWHVFPDCFLEAAGVTPFERLGLVISCSAYAATLVLLIRRSRDFDAYVFKLLVATLIAFFVEDLASAMASGLDGLARIVAHLCQVVALYLVYKAFVEVGLTKPYDLLFRSQQQTADGLRMVLEASAIGWWRLDLVNRRLTADDRCRALFGSPRDTEPSLELFFERVFPDDRGQAMDHLAKATAAPGMYQAEYRMAWPDGSLHWVFIKGRSLHDGPGGRPRCVEGIVMDVTDRKQAEARQRELDVQMLQSQKLESLGVLAGGIAHDFNNILTGIMGHADLAALELPADAAARTSIDRIRQASQRAGDLVRQMLAYAGGGQFQSEALDLAATIDQLRPILAVSVSKKATLEYDLTDSLPAVQGDATQVQQVVMNLVINASEALGEKCGEIRLSARRVDFDSQTAGGFRLGQELPPGPCVCLAVADTGCGIDPHVASRIFEPFFSTKFAGRGLGLAAVYGIVRAHRGALQVQSQPGQGTTFRVFFPASPELPAPAPAEVAPAAWRGSGTVLVVDDEELVRQMCRRMLGHSGFSVLTAADGQEALRIYRDRNWEIDCVLLDLTMPRMDGAETLLALRGIRPDARVILSSGHPPSVALARFGDHGAAGYLQKPYRFDGLLAALRQALTGNDEATLQGPGE